MAVEVCVAFCFVCYDAELVKREPKTPCALSTYEISLSKLFCFVCFVLFIDHFLQFVCITCRMLPPYDLTKGFQFLSIAVFTSTSQDALALTMLCIFSVFLLGIVLIACSLCCRYHNCHIPCRRRNFFQAVAEDEETETTEPQILQVDEDD